MRQGEGMSARVHARPRASHVTICCGWVRACVRAYVRAHATKPRPTPTARRVCACAGIQNLSMRDVVVFRNPFDEAIYRRVVDCCQLRPDIAILPHGDATEIGQPRAAWFARAAFTCIHACHFAGSARPPLP